jgi:hypothetical protein
MKTCCAFMNVNIVFKLWNVLIGLMLLKDKEEDK